MLDEVLSHEISKRGLSNRAVARQIDIAHTTLERALRGNQIDLEGIQKVAKWLHVSVSTLLDIEDQSRSIAFISVWLERNPEIRDALINLDRASDGNTFYRIELFLEFLLYQNWLLQQKPIRGGVSEV